LLQGKTSGSRYNFFTFYFLLKETPMHYPPITTTLLSLLLLLSLAVIILIEINVLTYAFHKMGVHHRYVLSLLLLSLLGSYINIPIYQLTPDPDHPGGILYFFDVPPMVAEAPGTVIAINLGGAVIPAILAGYLIVKNQLYFRALLGTAITAVIFHRMARLVPGVGIAVPILVPALVALGIGIILSWRHAPALSYVVGTLGTLIGADLANLAKLDGLGTPAASIGGAGTFDGIFLTGILAVLLAGLMGPGRQPWEV
jgi:uncharacterized membrane protein